MDAIFDIMVVVLVEYASFVLAGDLTVFGHWILCFLCITISISDLEVLRDVKLSLAYFV